MTVDGFEGLSIAVVVIVVAGVAVVAGVYGVEGVAAAKGFAVVEGVAAGVKPVSESRRPKIHVKSLFFLFVYLLLGSRLLFIARRNVDRIYKFLANHSYI